MSVVLMWGHCLRHRLYIKQHMSAGRVAHRKRLRHRPPHLTATCMRVELMVSQRRRQRANIKKTFFEKLMNIQYLNLPPYPNRWMVWLIQQGLAWRPRCVKTCYQEDAINMPNLWFRTDVNNSNPRSLTFQAGSLNHCTRAPAPKLLCTCWPGNDIWLPINVLHCGTLWTCGFQKFAAIKCGSDI